MKAWLQRSFIGKCMFALTARFQFGRTRTEDEYQYIMTELWKAGFVFDWHLKKLLNDDAKFKELLKRRSKLSCTMRQLSDKMKK